MAEDYRWLFVDSIPLLYDKKRVAKQLQVETWLDLAQVMKELGIEKTEANKSSSRPSLDYVI
jgi:hypothetical protein